MGARTDGTARGAIATCGVRARRILASARYSARQDRAQRDVGGGQRAVEGLGLTGTRAEFWRGTRVLVTGHTGFKGAWLTLWLQQMGADVAGYALAPPAGPSAFSLSRLDELVRSEFADIRYRDQPGGRGPAGQRLAPAHLVH